VTTPPPADGPAPVQSPHPPPFGPVPTGPVPPQPGPPRTGFTTPGYGYGQSPVQYPPPVPVGPSGHRLAEFSDRLLARIIDGLIVGVVGGIITAPVAIIAVIYLLGRLPTATRVNGELAGPAVDPTEFLLVLLGVFAVVLVMTFVINYVYDVEMMFRSGQTIGKRVMRIRVLPVDPGRTLTRAMAFKRYAVTVASAFVPGLGWVDGLWQLWDKPWRQCLHDKFAQTLVIKLDP
jgi:uncharacterized RDD family membrane protein YckC